MLITIRCRRVDNSVNGQDNTSYTLRQITLNSPIVISKDFVRRAPEGSVTVTNAVMQGEFKLRQALELTPTESFHFMSTSWGKDVISVVTACSLQENVDFCQKC